MEITRREFLEMLAVTSTTPDVFRKLTWAYGHRVFKLSPA